MLISGLQKLTLLDFPGHTACTVFTAGCNFRCPFCYNAPLVLRSDETPNIGEDEFFAFLAKRRGLLDGVCVTGGEPTLQTGLLDFLARIKEMGFLVKLDSNGSRPEVLREAIERGLVDRIAMDIKNSPERYAGTCGLRSLDLSPIRESIALLMEGRVAYEFRTTVTRELHSPGSIASAAEMIAGAREYYIQNFRDEGDLVGGNFTECSKDELETLLSAAIRHIPNAKLRGVD